jgi:hypothetical protein
MSYSFQKGYKQVPVGKCAAVKGELMEALSITSRPGWTARLKGKVEPKVTEARAIEQIFARHGIKQVWGE